MSTTMLKSLIATLALESQEQPKTIAEEAVADVAAEKTAEAEKAAADAAVAPTDTPPAEAVPAEESTVTEEEVEKVEDVTQALESLCLMMESAVKSGKGYSRLELALHDTAVVGHCKRLKIEPPLRPSLESIDAHGAEAETQLVLESLESYVEKLQDVALEAAATLAIESGGIFSGIKSFIRSIVKALHRFLYSTIDFFTGKADEVEELRRRVKEAAIDKRVAPEGTTVSTGFITNVTSAGNLTSIVHNLSTLGTKFFLGKNPIIELLTRNEVSDIITGKAGLPVIPSSLKPHLPGAPNIDYDMTTKNGVITIKAKFEYNDKPSNNTAAAIGMQDCLKVIDALQDWFQFMLSWAKRQEEVLTKYLPVYEKDGAGVEERYHKWRSELPAGEKAADMYSYTSFVHCVHVVMTSTIRYMEHTSTTLVSIVEHSLAAAK